MGETRHFYPTVYIYNSIQLLCTSIAYSYSEQYRYSYSVYLQHIAILHIYNVLLATLCIYNVQLTTPHLQRTSSYSVRLKYTAIICIYNVQLFCTTVHSCFVHLVQCRPTAILHINNVQLSCASTVYSFSWHLQCTTIMNKTSILRKNVFAIYFWHYFDRYLCLYMLYLMDV